MSWRFFSRTTQGMKALVALGAMLCVSMAWGQQDAGGLRKVVESYVKQETASLRGQVSVTVGTVDAPGLPACSRVEAFLPPNSRLWGSTNVGVRCAQGANWTLYVPVQVRVRGDAVVAARPLALGRQLAAEDLTTQRTDLTQLPPGTLVDINDAIGKIMTIGVTAGAPLRQDMLRAPFLVRQGARVRLVAEGQGFRVYSEGKAMGNASVGQTVQVKAQNGQLVTGTVRADGAVEVQF